MSDNLSIPDYLKIPPEERRRAWRAQRPLSPTVVERVETTERDEAKARNGRARRAAARRDRTMATNGCIWDATKAQWINPEIEIERRHMTQLYNMSGAQLVAYYNEMAGKVNVKTVGPKTFKNIGMAIERCQKLEKVLEARDKGVVEKLVDVKDKGVVKKEPRQGTLKQRAIDLFQEQAWTTTEMAKKLYGNKGNRMSAIKGVMLGINVAIANGRLNLKWSEEPNKDKAGKLVKA
jgi:hypothetical protein